MNVEIYCDGSSEGNSTGKGGWGYVIVCDKVKDSEGRGHLNIATNNIAEIEAALAGLAKVQGDPRFVGADVTLISDSQLVLKYATGEYQCKKPHLLQRYIKLRGLHKTMGFKTRWVKGHSGDEHNERCDVLAKAAKDNIDPS